MILKYGNSDLTCTLHQNFELHHFWGFRHPKRPDLDTNFALFWLDVSTELVHFQFPDQKTHGKLPSSCHIQPLIFIAKNWDWHRFTSSSTSSSSRKWSKAGFLVNIHIIHIIIWTCMELNDLRSSLSRLDSDSTSLVHQQCPAQRTCIPFHEIQRLDLVG